MIDLDDPAAVAQELRRRGIPIHRASDPILTDERLKEIFSAARLGGWSPRVGPPKPRFVNRGRLIREMERVG